MHKYLSTIGSFLAIISTLTTSTLTSAQPGAGPKLPLESQPSSREAAASASAADTWGWFDAEVDPIAYVAHGSSLHVGLRTSRLRFDLGAFSIVEPEFIHGQKDFEDGASGYGTKIDLYLLQPQTGPFIGIEGGLMNQQIVEERSQTRKRISSIAAGGRMGWQFELPAHFFIKPWIGVGHRFGNDDVPVAGRTFHQSSLLIFPTFHVGYSFR